jgi:hypothetical protein
VNSPYLEEFSTTEDVDITFSEKKWKDYEMKFNGMLNLYFKT